MSTAKPGQGNKTHEQFLRNLEQKDDMAETADADRDRDAGQEQHDRAARQSEFSVSRGGMNQESRDHHKHNNPGQGGHKPQRHTPDQEKH